MTDRFFVWLDNVTAEAKASPVGKILTAKGWEVAHTGGGCLAWEKHSADTDYYAWITAGDNDLGHDIVDPEKGSFTLGLYGCVGQHAGGGYGFEGGWVNPPENVEGLTAALAWCDKALAEPRGCFAEAKEKGWSMEDQEFVGQR